VTVQRTLVLASGNPGKLRELRELLRGAIYHVESQEYFGVGEVEESGATFLENALIKARHAAAITGMASLADDSGLEVDVLGGAPGIHSARFAGPRATDQQNLELLLERIQDTGVVNPAARYQCVIAFLRKPGDPEPLIARGTWEGHIVMQPAGDNGFGYDPIFFVPGHQCTAAQLQPELKNRINHRGQALQQLLDRIIDAGRL